MGKKFFEVLNIYVTLDTILASQKLRDGNLKQANGENS